MASISDVSIISIGAGSAPDRSRVTGSYLLHASSDEIVRGPMFAETVTLLAQDFGSLSDELAVLSSGRFIRPTFSPFPVLFVGDVETKKLAEDPDPPRVGPFPPPPANRDEIIAKVFLRPFNLAPVEAKYSPVFQGSFG